MSKQLELKNLSFKRGEHILFDTVNISVRKGDFIFLSGQTGVGKSTLFALLSGLEKLTDDGHIYINGQDVSCLSQVERFRLTGILFQNPNRQFVMKTLRREIRFALENMGFGWTEIRERQKEACDVTKTESLLDRPFSKLSGGEKQRAALAVLVAMDTPLFLLDEPFACVDQSHRYLLLGLLSDLAKKGKTILISDHDHTGYNQFANRHWKIKERKIEEALPSQLPPKRDYRLVQEGYLEKETLHFKNVSKKLGEKLLWQVSDFSLLEGITTLTGDNGTGKSTLLRAISHLTSYKGKIFMQGKLLKKHRYLYQRLTLTVQEALQQFVTLMPKQELAFSKEQWPDAHNWQELLIQKTSLKDQMSVSLMYLSGGQQKLIQLMAMLSQKVPFLLMDEPFNGLDDTVCKLITDWMLSNHQRYGQNFLVVSHRLSPLEDVSHHHVLLADQTLFLFDKKEVAK